MITHKISSMNSVVMKIVSGFLTVKSPAALYAAPGRRDKALGGKRPKILKFLCFHRLIQVGFSNSDTYFNSASVQGSDHEGRHACKIASAYACMQFIYIYIHILGIQFGP